MPTNLRANPLAGANEALARSVVYRLLSQAFAYPTEAGVEQLREEDLPLASAASGPLPEEARAALEEAVAAFDRVPPEELETAFRGVFTHIHSTDCPTYETDYTSREVWRQSQELADLAGFYRAFGMEEQAERPDHVAVELEFMHLVTYKAAWALIQDETEHAAVCLEAAERFLADHLLKWVPGFAARVEAVAAGGPYGAVARLARAFLRTEATRFGLPIEEAIEPAPVHPDARTVETAGLCEGEA